MTDQYVFLRRSNCRMGGVMRIITMTSWVNNASGLWKSETKWCWRFGFTRALLGVRVWKQLSCGNRCATTRSVGYFLSALHATNMSVATNGNPSERSRCYKFFWRLFPHVFLILSLIAYAALGAVVFCKIEGGRDVSNQQPYQEFISKLMAKKNASGKSYYCTLNGLAYLSIYSGLSLDQTWLQNSLKFMQKVNFNQIGYCRWCTLNFANSLVFAISNCDILFENGPM